MQIQNRNGSIDNEVGLRTMLENSTHYFAAVPNHLLDEESSLIDRIIAFALDKLHVRHLEVRVYDADACPTEAQSDQYCC